MEGSLNAAAGCAANDGRIVPGHRNELVNQEGGMNSSLISADLATRGWCVFTAPVSIGDDPADEVRAVAQELGEIVAGRARQTVERIVPHTPSSAFAGSLSSKYGLEPLPLHTDTAHWPTPCRYLVMACAAVGPVSTPTTLLDGQLVKLSEVEATACDRAVFLVRNGRHSFYGSIKRRDRAFVRVDPGCMSPLSSDGELAIRAFGAERHESALYRHEWKVGEILVIDNWRVLHGRGDGAGTEPGRVLLRAMVR